MCVSFIFNGYDSMTPIFWRPNHLHFFQGFLGSNGIWMDEMGMNEFTDIYLERHCQIWMVQSFAAIQESEK